MKIQCIKKEKPALARRITVALAVIMMAAGAAAADGGLRVDGINSLPCKKTSDGTELFGALAFAVSGAEEGVKLYRPLYPTGAMPGSQRIGEGHSQGQHRDFGELGVIRPAEGKSVVRTNESDWTSGSIVIEYEAGAKLSVRASRLSPALLATFNGTELIFFGGPKKMPRLEERRYVLADAPANPRYAAFGAAGGGVKVVALSRDKTVVPADTAWMLTWQGGNSHFVVSAIPSPMMAASVALAMERGYFVKAETPFLFVFQSAPAAASLLPEGGLKLIFTKPAGAIALMPLTGDVYLRAETTEAWGEAAALPPEITDAARAWSARLAEYPLSVEETWTYDQAQDRFTVTSRLKYLTLRNGGTRFAPLPPMLGIALQQGFPVAVSAPVASSGLALQFGPYLGVEGAEGYSYTISGMAKYVQEQIKLGTNPVPPRLKEEIKRQIAKVVAAGHLAPWNHFGMSTAGSDYLGWNNPGDVLRFLRPALPHLDEPDRSALQKYLDDEIAQYPPDRTGRNASLSYAEGTRREPYALNQRNVERLSAGSWIGVLPPANIYAVAELCSAQGGNAAAEKWKTLRAYATAEQSRKGWLTAHEWATLGFFDKSNPWWSNAGNGIHDTNRLLTGLVGYLRLAAMAGETDETLMTAAWGMYYKLLAKLYAEWNFSRNMFRNKVLALPENPAWMAEVSKGNFDGRLYPPKWTEPEDDLRLPVFVSEFGVFLHDVVGIPHSFISLPAFLGLCPETARFLLDYAAENCSRYIKGVETVWGDWFIAHKESTISQENGINYPEDSYQLFTAKAWILNEPAEALERYIDVPWVPLGDFFYIHKLALTADAYRGATWSK